MPTWPSERPPTRSHPHGVLPLWCARPRWRFFLHGVFECHRGVYALVCADVIRFAQHCRGACTGEKQKRNASATKKRRPKQTKAPRPTNKNTNDHTKKGKEKKKEKQKNTRALATNTSERQHIFRRTSGFFGRTYLARFSCFTIVNAQSQRTASDVSATIWRTAPAVAQQERK